MGLRSSTSMSLPGLCMVGALELLLVLSLMHGAFAQDTNCTAASLAPLLPCVQYIQPGNTTMPGSDCCDPLRSILTSTDPTCICQIAPLAQQSGTSINQTRALEVAALCNQTVPSSIISCLSSGSASAPLGTPPGTPTSSSAAPPPQQGNDNSSVGSALLPPFLLIGSIFVVLSLHLGIMST